MSARSLSYQPLSRRCDANASDENRVVNQSLRHLFRRDRQLSGCATRVRTFTCIVIDKLESIHCISAAIRCLLSKRRQDRDDMASSKSREEPQGASTVGERRRLSALYSNRSPVPLGSKRIGNLEGNPWHCNKSSFSPSGTGHRSCLCQRYLASRVCHNRALGRLSLERHISCGQFRAVERSNGGGNRRCLGGRNGFHKWSAVCRNGTLGRLGLVHGS